MTAPALFTAMSALVETLGGCLMGSEALLLLRAEKGYLIAGKDTDGTTIPGDLGLNGPRDKRRDEFVGKRSLFTDNAMRADRPQFVGLSIEGGEPLPTGAHGVERSGAARRSIGFVTSSYFSPTLARPIALGLIERGLSRIGETIELVHLDATLHATITAACAFDPEGTRLNVSEPIEHPTFVMAGLVPAISRRLSSNRPHEVEPPLSQPDELRAAATLTGKAAAEPRGWPGQARPGPAPSSAAAVRDAVPDPMAKWTPVPDWTSARIECGTWSARPAALPWAALLGGDIGAAIAALAPEAPEIGLFEVADAPRHLIRIARDKALLVAAAPIEMSFGWNAGGWSATPADSMNWWFDLSGPETRRVLAEATAADLELGSRSAAILFAGVPALIYRSAVDVARLAVETGFAPYVWRWLETRKG